MFPQTPTAPMNLTQPAPAGLSRSAIWDELAAGLVVAGLLLIVAIVPALLA